MVEVLESQLGNLRNWFDFHGDLCMTGGMAVKIALELQNSHPLHVNMFAI